VLWIQCHPTNLGRPGNPHNSGPGICRVWPKVKTATMENIHKRSSEFENYPFPTADEFAEACHHLDRKYIQAELGPLRRQWKLRVNRALIMAFTPAAEYSTYIQIIRPLELDLDDGNLSAALDKLSFDVTNGAEGASIDADEQMREAEDQDDVGLGVQFPLHSSISSHIPGRATQPTSPAEIGVCHLRNPPAPLLPKPLSLVHPQRPTAR